MKKPLIIIGSISFILLVFISLFDLSKVSGNSMEPNYSDGQYLLVWRGFLEKPEIHKGDVVIYKKEGIDNNFVGRVVGLPTESIRVQNGFLYLDTNEHQYKVTEEYEPQNVVTVATPDSEWVRISQFNYMILPDKRQDNLLNLHKSLINIYDIKGVVRKAF